MTILQRLIADGYPEHIARRHLRYGRVRVNGCVVFDPQFPMEADDKVWIPEGL